VWKLSIHSFIKLKMYKHISICVCVCERFWMVSVLLVQSENQASCQCMCVCIHVYVCHDTRMCGDAHILLLHSMHMNASSTLHHHDKCMCGDAHNIHTYTYTCMPSTHTSLKISQETPHSTYTNDSATQGCSVAFMWRRRELCINICHIDDHEQFSSMYMCTCRPKIMIFESTKTRPHKHAIIMIP
jgi:hypothetical protein